VRGRRPPVPPEQRGGLLAWLKRLLGIGIERKAPTRAQTESRALEDFQKHFRLTFADPELLKLALTHRSYLSVTGQGPRESNERLEFLGDSVLGLVTSEFLYRENPEEHEGDLTKAKSLLVSKAILSRRALAMGLGRFVLMSHSEVESGGRQRLSILADAFEAVIGAVYLDQGFEPARAFIHRWLLSESGEIVADKRHTNYKSHLQEYVQSTWRTHPVYRIRSEMGPDHSKHFLVEVLVGKRSLGDGRGRNKKEAEQAAARNALERAGVSVGGVDHEEEVTHEEPAPLRAPAERPRIPAEPERGRSEDVETEPTGEAHGRGRRGRRGGRDRGERRPLAAAPPVHDLDDEPRAADPGPGRLAAPTNRLKPIPEPPAMAPALPEKEPPPSRHEEDELDDVGRPEGPLEELHVDPFAWGVEPAATPEEEIAPAARAATEVDDEEGDEWDEEPVAGTAPTVEDDDEPAPTRSAAPPPAAPRHEPPLESRREPAPAPPPAPKPEPPTFGRRRSRRG